MPFFVLSLPARNPPFPSLFVYHSYQFERTPHLHSEVGEGKLKRRLDARRAFRNSSKLTKKREMGVRHSVSTTTAHEIQQVTMSVIGNVLPMFVGSCPRLSTMVAITISSRHVPGSVSTTTAHEIQHVIMGVIGNVLPMFVNSCPLLSKMVAITISSRHVPGRTAKSERKVENLAPTLFTYSEKSRKLGNVDKSDLDQKRCGTDSAPHLNFQAAANEGNIRNDVLL